MSRHRVELRRARQPPAVQTGEPSSFNQGRPPPRHHGPSDVFTAEVFRVPGQQQKHLVCDGGAYLDQDLRQADGRRAELSQEQDALKEVPFAPPPQLPHGQKDSVIKQRPLVDN